MPLDWLNQWCPPRVSNVYAICVHHLVFINLDFPSAINAQRCNLGNHTSHNRTFVLLDQGSRCSQLASNLNGSFWEQNQKWYSVLKTCTFQYKLMCFELAPWKLHMSTQIFWCLVLSFYHCCSPNYISFMWKQWMIHPSTIHLDYRYWAINLTNWIVDTSSQLDFGCMCQQLLLAHKKYYSLIYFHHFHHLCCFVLLCLSELFLKYFISVVLYLFLVPTREFSEGKKTCTSFALLKIM